MKGRGGSAGAAAFALLIVLVLPDGVFGAARGILDFTLQLFGFAFGLKLGIAGDFARRILHLAFGLMGGAFDAITVHMSFLCGTKEITRERLSGFRIRKTAQLQWLNVAPTASKLSDCVGYGLSLTT